MKRIEDRKMVEYLFKLIKNNHMRLKKHNLED